MMEVAFSPTVRVRVLASRVLAVAETRIDGSWKAYCAAVPGNNHMREAPEVLRHGDDIGEELACFLFPEFRDLPYAR